MPSAQFEIVADFWKWFWYLDESSFHKINRSLFPFPMLYHSIVCYQFIHVKNINMPHLSCLWVIVAEEADILNVSCTGREHHKFKETSHSNCFPACDILSTNESEWRIEG